ncbi:MAG: phage tail protein [Gammaproteobacteria bacterium]|nr:phage tail protein [Gammaproteobacteria bacterium]
MATPFIGEIVMFGGNFAPRSWALCDGQLLSISQNTALFSILGTTYGGDGRTTFGLPDLRGRVPMHPGNGPGLTPRSLGQKAGVEDVLLNTNQIPSHTHTATSTANAVTPAGNSNDAAGNFWADDAGVASGTYHSGPANAAMNAGAVTTTLANTGGNQEHTNVQPFLCVNFIIALQGVFPSRN